MNRRHFLHAASAFAWAAPAMANPGRPGDLESVADVLAGATADGRVQGAALCVRRGADEFRRHFGSAPSIDVPFLLGSISKPMAVAALMTLHDRDEFRLDDPVRRFLPEFSGDSRERVTIRHLLTHVSGLPDQLPENNALRARHATLPEFVERAMRTPLLFEPGSQYSYSSMAILLASEIALRIRGGDLPSLMDQAVFGPLGMRDSALGLGRFPIDAVMPCQTEDAAPESGAGDPEARDWDWNSPYWRSLGAPWGGVHASAPDVARFFAEFLHPGGRMLRPETARLMIRNHNPEGLTPRGLGFAVGPGAGGRGCSAATFGHTGSTGTLAWADPESDTICVVLTTLPGGAIDPHPRTIASDRLASLVS